MPIGLLRPRPSRTEATIFPGVREKPLVSGQKNLFQNSLSVDWLSGPYFWADALPNEAERSNTPFLLTLRFRATPDFEDFSKSCTS